MEYENNYASKGVANAGLVTGIIGTALGTVGSGVLNGFTGNENKYITHETYDVQMKLIEAERKSAILQADLDSERKMVETFNGAINRINTVKDDLQNQINEVRATVNSNAASQAVINCGFNSGINLLQNQMNQLFGMTKLIIPNASVLPGWGTNSSGG